MKYSSVIISGASSGIGFALAQDLATSNCHLCLLGRNLDKLKSIQKNCQEKGAKVEIYSVDITDGQKIKEIILDFDQRHPVDLVIANAGIGTAQSANSNQGNADYKEIIQTNILGVHHLIDPLIPSFKKRKSGQIAIMSSLASFRGFAKYYVYNGTKAYLRIYGQGLRLDLARYQVKVSTIAPGFVKTPLTDANTFEMPFILSAQKASQIILKGLGGDQSLIAFPKISYYILRLLIALPNKLADYFASKIAPGDRF